MHNIAIVGNGALTCSDRKKIDDADRILRFNLTGNANGQPAPRTDWLLLACSTKQVGSYLSQGDYRRHPAFAAADEIVSTYHPTVIANYMPRPSLLSRLKGRRADWTPACRAACAEMGKPLHILPRQLYLSACDRLEIAAEGRQFFPSSGFLAVLWLAGQTGAEPRHLHLFGFGFQGWKQHLWQAERDQVRALQAEGRLTLHPAQ